MLMTKSFHDYEFKYFVSAFLSAVSARTEHLRLFSSDPRFKDWYRDIVQNVIPKSDLPRLDKLRNKEVHQKGTDAWQRVGWKTSSEPLVSTQIEVTLDFSNGAPTSSYKTAEMEKAAPLEVGCDWVWTGDEDCNVIHLCQSGLNTASQIIESRMKMGFKD